MKKVKKVLKLSFALFCGISFFCNVNKPCLNLNSNPKQANNLKSASEDSEVIVSYLSVMDFYYNLATDNIQNPTITFDEFLDSYYSDSNRKGIYEYTLDVARENGNYTSVYDELYGDEYGIAPMNSSSSGGNDNGGGPSGEDASYILKDSKSYYSTPSSAFHRAPVYSAYDYSSLENGDIVWETETVLFDSGHDALIVDMNHNSAYGSYIQTIEAVGGGVQRGFLDDQRMVYYRCEILRVNGRTATNSKKAISFIEKQLGKKYSLVISRLNTSIDSNEWYCSEFVYASWKYAGIEIGVKNGVYLKLGCLPNDIAASDNIIRIPMAYYDYLSLSVDSKSNGVWNIKVYNPTSIDLTIYYNQKMCLYADAQNWTALSNIQEVEIASHKSAIVVIKENWLSTSITASYIIGEYRIITYANELNKNGSLNAGYNIVEK